jgi:DNA-binding MarR family transcriptional regulator
MATTSAEQKQPSCPTLPEYESRAWFGFMHAHAELVRELDAVLLAEHGLSLSAHEVLLRLEQADGGNMRMSELAGLVTVSPSRVTRLVDGLQRDRLLHREPCSTDARVTYAQITPAGRKRLAAAQETHLRAVRERFLSHFSDAELRSLSDFWTRLGAG